MKEAIKEPEIKVGISQQEALALMAEAEREEISREAKRSAMAAEVARFTWEIAQNHHRLPNGARLQFNDYPFQPDIYRDQAVEQVACGSVQWGKSIWLLIKALAGAGIGGLNVLFCFAKYEKRDKVVSSLVSPALGSIPLYQKLVEAAKDRSAHADSNRMKHFGAGSINFIAATSERDFSTYAADSAMVDEHQECNQDLIGLLDDRLSGSPWGFKTFVGNPRTIGTDENQNLDYQYQQSDRRKWYVPCPTCKEEFVLDWWQHVVFENRNKGGGILSVTPRDEEFRPGSALDMRPVCSFCHRPVNRLSRKGLWVAQNPGHRRHGYVLSNLYNAHTRLDRMFDKYLSVRNNPVGMAAFRNNQLGLAFSSDGSRVDESMLAGCSTGELSKVPTFKFQPCSGLDWKKDLAA